MQQDDTVNAAAVVLAAAARSTTGLLPHHQQQITPTTRWWSRLKAKLLLCFGRISPHGRRHPRHRIAAYASPGPVHSSSSTTSYHHTHHATRPVVAFAAPPPSPASSALTSESTSPSPVQLLLNLNTSGYSSPATASIFAVGPYALDPPQPPVSPPSFSAGITEPSTAPLTPPPEPTTACCSFQPGSSPDVPFARFLSPSFHQGHYQLQLDPGSPIGGTIVLSSPVSTSSSPAAAWLHRRSSEEGLPPSGEFVFDGAAGEWATFADGGDGGRGASISSIGDDAAATEDANQQWPFRSSLSS